MARSTRHAGNFRTLAGIAVADCYKGRRIRAGGLHQGRRRLLLGRPTRTLHVWDETFAASQGRKRMDYRDRITIDPGKRSGKPCIRGLRITVSDVLEYLASGMSEDEILAEFTDLERDDIRASLAFAADRERRLMAVPPA